MVLLDGFSSYLLENGYTENTKRAYLRAVQLYSVYNAGKQPESRGVQRFKAHLLETRTPATVNLMLAGISKYCRFAGLNVSIRYVKVQRRTSIENVLTEQEVQLLLDALDADGNIRLAAIVRLMAKTGARISEVLRFRKCDLQRGFVDMQTKGKVRRIYFPKCLAAELRPLTESLSDGDMLCRNRRGEQITGSGVRKTLKRYAARCGIPPEHVHPHAFRHYYAVSFLRRNPNLALLADLLGHSGIGTTQIYLRMTQEQQQEEVDKTVDW